MKQYKVTDRRGLQLGGDYVLELQEKQAARRRHQLKRTSKTGKRYRIIGGPVYFKFDETLGIDGTLSGHERACLVELGETGEPLDEPARVSGRPRDFYGVTPEEIAAARPDLASEIGALAISKLTADQLAEARPDLASEIGSLAISKLTADQLAEARPDLGTVAETSEQGGLSLEPDANGTQESQSA